MILVVRFGKSDPHIIRRGRSSHIHVRYYKGEVVRAPLSVHVGFERVQEVTEVPGCLHLREDFYVKSLVSGRLHTDIHTYVGIRSGTEWWK